MTLIFPVLFAFVGLLVYLVSSNAKAQEVGRIIFACGLLVSLWAMSARVFHLPI